MWRSRARAFWLCLLGASWLRRRGNLLFSFGRYACGGFCLLVYSFWTGFSKFRFYHKEVKSSSFGKKPSFLFTKTKAGKPSYSVDLSDHQNLQAEVDRILDKINEKGFGALSQKEKNTLDKAKGLLNKH